MHLRLKGSGGFLFADGICLRLVPAGGTIPKKHQLYLEFEDGTRLVGSVQMYGALIGYDSLPVSAYDEAARQKPCPLSDDFSPVYFDGLLRNVKPFLSAKAFLATEQRIPGLGNGVLQDILFRAGVHPKRAVSSLSSADQDALFGSVKTTLREMAEAGGRNTEKDLYGRPGGYFTLLCRNTVLYPCPHCGASLVKEAYLGGSIYFCPSCQPSTQYYKR